VHGGISSRTNTRWVREHVVGNTNDFYTNDFINNGHSTALVSNVPTSRASIMTSWRDVQQIGADAAILASSGGLRPTSADATNGQPGVKHPPSLRRRRPPPGAAVFKSNAYGQRRRRPSAADKQERFTQELAFPQPKPNQPAEIPATVVDGAGNFSNAT
jgi:hypothetical protein